MKKNSTNYSKAHEKCFFCRSPHVRMGDHFAFDQGKFKVHVDCCRCFCRYVIILEPIAVEVISKGMKL